MTLESGSMGPMKATPELDRRARILAVVDSIPRGRVATYGGVAAEAGLPGRARLVGRTLRGLGPDSKLPWHRVLGSPGKISLPPEGAAGQLQRQRLTAEGIEVSRSGRVDLSRHGWPSDS